MMAFRSLKTIRALFRATQIQEPAYLLGSLRSYTTGISNVAEINNRNVYSSLFHGALPWTSRNAMTLRSSMAVKLPMLLSEKRLLSTQVKAPAQARKMGGLTVSMTSPGFIYEPYAPREKVPFFRRWFTRSGWRKTKEEIILELKSAYAIHKLRKSGYSKNLFYKEAVTVYKEINNLLATGDKNTLRKAVTEKMYSELKNEIKQRESIWSKVYWEMVEPIVKIRTLRARVIGVDPKDLEKVFIQITLEFLSKQKFEAYDSKGSVISGDKSKEKGYLTSYLHITTRKEIQEMDGIEQHLQSLGICQRLYNFIRRRLASHAFKSATLGPPMIQGLPSIPEDAVLSEAGTQCNGKVHPNPLSDVITEETEARRPSIASRAKPPRKTVSINDEVEDIEKTLKLRRKNKSFEKLNSLDLPNYEQIPQRSSILKVGSYLSKKRAAFVNHNYN